MKKLINIYHNKTSDLAASLQQVKGMDQQME
jgi:hypothetical protein